MQENSQKTEDKLCQTLEEIFHSDGSKINHNRDYDLADRIFTKNPNLVHRINAELFTREGIVWDALIETSDDHKALRTLIKHGIDVNKQNNEQETPLMFATQVLDKAAVQLLLEQGVDINQHSENIDTALHMAINSDAVPKNTDVIKLLLNHGADPDIVNANWQKPDEILTSLGDHPFENEIKDLFTKARLRKTANNGVASAMEKATIDGKSSAAKTPERDGK